MTPAVHVSEAQFQRKVIDYARLRGWRVHHGRAATVRPGKVVTPITGQVGFPDLVLARGGRVVLAELKAEDGVLSKAQHEWLAAIGTQAVVWRPSDWDDIEQVLR